MILGVASNWTARCIAVLAAAILHAPPLNATTTTPSVTSTVTPTCTPAPCAPRTCGPGEWIVCSPCGCVCGCAAYPSPTPTPTPPSCPGDCDDDRRVTVDELIRGVNVALGLAPVETCPHYGACSQPVCIAIDLVVGAVEHALVGCPTHGAPCGDAAVRERYAQCRTSDTEDQCVAAGGQWGVYPYSRREGCFCRTGEGGCACTSSRECLGFCYGSGDPSADGCRLVREGTCSALEPQAGCRCELIGPGRAIGLCVDP